MFNQEPERLDPEIIKHLVHGELMSFVNHPFVTGPYVPGDEYKTTIPNGCINRAFRFKRECYEHALTEQGLIPALRYVEPAHRLDVAMKHLAHLDAKEYWDLVLWVWEQSDLATRARTKVWCTLFHRPGNPVITSEVFNGLPEILTVYRAGDLVSLSWTTNLEEAQEQAALLGVPVWKGTVRKSNVLHMSMTSTKTELIIDSYNVNELVAIDESAD